MVLSHHRRRRHGRPADRPHGDRRALALDPWPMGTRSRKPHRAHLVLARKMVVTRPRHRVRRSRTAAGGWSITAMKTASGRSAANACSIPSTGRKTAGSAPPAAISRSRSPSPSTSPAPNTAWRSRMISPQTALGLLWAFHAPSTHGICAPHARQQRPHTPRQRIIPHRQPTAHLHQWRSRLRSRSRHRTRARAPKPACCCSIPPNSIAASASPSTGLVMHRVATQRRNAPPADFGKRLQIKLQNDRHIVTCWTRTPGPALDPIRRPLRNQRLQPQHRLGFPEPAPGPVLQRTGQRADPVHDLSRAVARTAGLPPGSRGAAASIHSEDAKWRAGARRSQITAAPCSPDPTRSRQTPRASPAAPDIHPLRSRYR